jgi:hypothetical protein
MNYSGYIGFNDHYGEFLIGEHIGNNNYTFYTIPITKFDNDYHPNIKLFAASDLILEGTIDLSIIDGDFEDFVEIGEYIGLDYSPKTKLYIGSPTGEKKKQCYKNDWSTMETAIMLRVNKDDTLMNGFAFDNAIFALFQNGQSFNELAYLEKLDELIKKKLYPQFIVVPDIIGGGLESLTYSINFMKKLEHIPFPKYLVVQDGMTTKDVEPFLDRSSNKQGVEFDAIFVGGKPTFKGFGKKQSKEVEWKLKTMEAWTKLAHKHGKKCHVGRVSSIRRLNFARSIGADSCDTSMPNFSMQQFNRYKKASKQTIISF